MDFTRRLELTLLTYWSLQLAPLRKIAGSRHTAEVSANLLLHALHTKSRKARFATRSAVTASLLMASSADKTVQMHKNIETMVIPATK